MTRTFDVRVAALLVAGALTSTQALASPAGVRPSAAPADGCASVAALQLDGVEIVSAQTQPAGTPAAGAEAVTAQLPQFCRVTAKARPEPGSDINFEVWLPAQGWDGRLFGAGNGGFAGNIAYDQLARAVKSGQVGVSTDTGHAAALTGAWARGRPERVRDYGWRAVHLATVAAKAMTAAYYGRGPRYAYFVSCSNGGRQGLMEASRFPSDYDGIVAGAPAASWTDIAISMAWSVRVQSEPGSAIRGEQAKLLQQQVLADCDKLDGQTDGIVADPRRCRVDLSKIMCGVNASPLCFTSQQVAALRAIYAGPRDRAGKAVVAGHHPSGAEAGWPAPMINWDQYLFPVGNRPTNARLGAEGVIQDLPSTAVSQVATFDFDKDPARLKAAVGADLDVQPDLTAFFERGGKLILYHGWADAAIPAEFTLQFHDAVLRSSGPRAAESVRLFMAPGLQHCAGGTGPVEFGQSGPPAPSDLPENSISAAIQAWVETGRKPDTLTGRFVETAGEALGKDPTVGRASRLICAYPAQAVLRVREDPRQARSYECRIPA